MSDRPIDEEHCTAGWLSEDRRQTKVIDKDKNKRQKIARQARNKVARRKDAEVTYAYVLYVSMFTVVVGVKFKFGGM